MKRSDSYDDAEESFYEGPLRQLTKSGLRIPLLTCLERIVEDPPTAIQKQTNRMPKEDVELPKENLAQPFTTGTHHRDSI